MRLDLQTWLAFLQHPSAFARLFIDYSKVWVAQEIQMYSDASKNPNLGFGVICGSSWMYARWLPADFILQVDPSIKYLELFALVAGCITWLHRFRNRCIILHCDNESICVMVNKTTSYCKNCVVLLRLLVLKSLIENVRVFAKHLGMKQNKDADLLSRMKISYFKRCGNGKFARNSTQIPECIWPLTKI